MPAVAHEVLMRPSPESLIPNEHIAQSLGGLSLEQSDAVEFDFSRLQADILGCISEGHTVNQVSRRLDVPRRAVKDTKKQMSEHFPSLSSAVNYAIMQGEIDFESKPDFELTAQLTALDIGILQSYLTGSSDQYLSEISGGNYDAVKKYEPLMLEKIKAWSRPHAVRRGYELGIFSIDLGEDES